MDEDLGLGRGRIHGLLVTSRRLCVYRRSPGSESFLVLAHVEDFG